MERKMFDMSEFYRSSSGIRAQSPAPVRANVNMGGADENDCANPLTMVFINMQPFGRVYPVDEGYLNGTIFPDLNKPFYGGVER